MTTRCIVCRKRVERGQLFCAECLQKRAPTSSRKRERRRRGQLLKLILSLPFLSASEKSTPIIIGGRGVVEDATVWRHVQPKIQSDPQVMSLFSQAAISLGIPPPAELNTWVGNMDGATGMPIFRRMVARISQSSGRGRSDVPDVQRRLLALSSPALGILVVVLAILSLGLLIIY
jgi:predicted nucleic acid-binding Zn ribbon protein